MSFEEQVMSEEKYPSIFSHQMEAIVFIILQIFFATRAIFSKWFEPRSISSSYCVIVRVRVVLKRTVVGD